MPYEYELIDGPPRKIGKKKLIVKIVLVATILITVFFVKGFMSAYAEFAAEESQYAALEKFALPFAELNEGVAVAPDPHIQGKLIVIEIDSGMVSRFFHDQLPDDLLATTPDEVGSIALLSWPKMKVGNYQDENSGDRTGSAFRTYGSVRVIDVKTRQVIAQDLFEGKMPTKTIKFDGDNTGLRPQWKLRDYLKSLPRR